MSEIKDLLNEIKSKERHEILQTFISDKGILITPNMRFLYSFRNNTDFKSIFPVDDSTMICDSWLLYFLLKRRKTRYPGSIFFYDFVVATEELNYYLLGGDNAEINEECIRTLKKMSPNNRYYGYSPPFGFENDRAQMDLIEERVKYHSIDVLVIGLGMAKQEIVALSLRTSLQVPYVFCIGSTINALGSNTHQTRRNLNVYGLEWTYRMIHEPLRFVQRKLSDMVEIFFFLKG